MALNFNLLRSFLAVADAGSVSGASRAGFTSQPALSKAIRELEKQVGLPLLERSSRGVITTEAGALLHEHARALFALESQTETALTALRDLDGGTLRIGATTTLASYILPPLLGAFRQKHPRITLRLERDNSRGIEAKLADYALDVAFIEGLPAHPNLRAQAWREDEVVLICAPNHPLCARELAWPADLKNESWIVRERGSGTREWVERALKPFDLPPPNAWEIGSAEAIKSAVAAGLGIAFVSRAAARDQIALGKLRVLRVAEIEIRRPVLSFGSRRPPTLTRDVGMGTVFGGRGLAINIPAIKPDAACCFINGKRAIHYKFCALRLYFVVTMLKEPEMCAGRVLRNFSEKFSEVRR